MKMRIIMTIALCISLIFVYAQDNDKVNRDAFTLKLPVNRKQYYEQEIKSTPYFVKENILQIYPGEKLFIEIEVEKETIVSMKVVKENLNPDRTIEIEFTQELKGKKNDGMLLRIENPFKKDLEYKAMMYIVGHDKWINTNVLPVKAKITGFEMWVDVIITLVLTEWKLK